MRPARPAGKRRGSQGEHGIKLPPYSRDSPTLVRSGSPKNGQERVTIDRDGVRHLQYFANGSWRHHNTKCKLWVNKECNKK